MKGFDEEVTHEAGKMNSSPDAEKQRYKRGKAENESFPYSVNEQQPKDTENDNVEIIHGSLLQS